MLLTILLVVLLVSAVVGYRLLSVRYNPPIQSGVSGKPTEEVLYAPNFTVLDGEGNEVSLSDFAGRPVVLNFWATWCGPCQMEMPDFESAWLEYGNDVEFMMLNMTDGSRDTLEGVKAFIEEAGYTFPVYFDTTYSAAYAYGAGSLPMTVFIDEDGILVGGQVGMISNNNLIAGIQSLLKE